MKKGFDQKHTAVYYNRFSNVYDLVSSKSYYHKARTRAVAELHLEQGKTVLNVPVGTGQNFEYFQKYLLGSGVILAVDLSNGMLDKAKKKVIENRWSNVTLVNMDVLAIDSNLIHRFTNQSGVDAVLCDLGLTAFPDWKAAIDKLISLLLPKGRLVIMDWYLEKASIRRSFINWIGKAEIDRPLWKYMEPRVNDFSLDTSFNRGGVFVASGTKPG